MNTKRKEASPWWITAGVLLGFFGAFYYLSTYQKPYCTTHVAAFSCRFNTPATKQEWKDAYNAIGHEYPE